LPPVILQATFPFGRKIKIPLDTIIIPAIVKIQPLYVDNVTSQGNVEIRDTMA